jgi:hypothetical protein
MAAHHYNSAIETMSSFLNDMETSTNIWRDELVDQHLAKINTA